MKASEKLNRFMMMAGKHDAVAKKYGVSGYPTFIFIGPDGKKVGDASRNAEALIKQIDEIAEKYNRAPKWAESEEAALKSAKTDEMPLVIFYRDDKPKSALAEQEFSAQPVAELYGKAVWVQKTLDVKSDEAKALGIKTLPEVWIIDARVDDAKARLLKKSAPRGATIKTDLAAILKTWKKTEGSNEEPKEEPKKE
ncbi:MAG TPA: hypothetical protein VFS19_01520 [Planctomycetota bacterium]|nr:hypothetical protein [Planctomycetota bacterium]